MDIILIPAYEPDKILIEISKNLKKEGFDVVVVDDGSGEKYSNIFNSVKPYAKIITHEKNRGKGAALKSGMRYILDNICNFDNIITCDADGQHMVKDVIKVRDCLHNGHKFVLTIRRAKKKIPIRSKIGNSLSRYVYTLLTNRYLSDNQSGLRGFCKDHVKWIVNVENDNYDYEMNVLYYAAKKNIFIATIPIDAVYINNNSSSHFNPLLDTYRIYKHLFKLAKSTFISFFVVEILVLMVSIIWGYKNLTITLPSIGAISYLISIILNKYVVFKNTHCYDYWNILVYTIISYFVYTLFCTLYMFAWSEVPLWLAFNFTYILCMPLRYYLNKFIFIASKRYDE